MLIPSARVTDMTVVYYFGDLAEESVKISSKFRTFTENHGINCCCSSCGKRKKIKKTKAQAPIKVSRLKKLSESD